MTAEFETTELDLAATLAESCWLSQACDAEIRIFEVSSSSAWTPNHLLIARKVGSEHFLDAEAGARGRVDVVRSALVLPPLVNPIVLLHQDSPALRLSRKNELNLLDLASSLFVVIRVAVPGLDYGHSSGLNGER